MHCRFASRLLRGKELQEAEQQLASAGSQKDPQPTTLQREYVLSSRREEDIQRQRELENAQQLAEEQQKRAEVQTLAAKGLRIFLITALVLATAAIFFAFQSRQQTRIALARQLVAQAQYIDRTQNARRMFAVLLATESMNIFPSSEAAQILINNNIMAKSIAHMTHDDEVWSVTFSPDGKYVLSGSVDGTARVWEATTGKEITRVYMSKTSWDHPIAFSPDGKSFVSPGCNPQIWETLTGNEVSPRPQPVDGCNPISTAFSTNGKYVALNMCDVFSEFNDCIQATVYVWELATGNVIAKMTNAYGGNNVVFSPDSRYIGA